MAASSGLFIATIYNQSQLAERKHVARYWSIDTAATAVPLSPHPSAITKLAAAILGGRLFGRSVLPAQYCPCDYKCNFIVQERLQNVLQILLKHKILRYDGEKTDTLPNDAILTLNLNYQRFASNNSKSKIKKNSVLNKFTPKFCVMSSNNPVNFITYAADYTCIY